MSAPGTGAWWQAASPHLDRALAMPEEDRARWLSVLGEQNPTLADLLRTLLEEHRALAEEGYLERSPLPLPLQAATAGQAVGAYRLVSLIGQGGMGSVWLAERSDGEIRHKVAIKLLRGAEVPALRDRFLRERQLLADLNHPSIARLLDAGHTGDGRPYLVMEYVDGVPIDAYAAKLGLRDRLAVFLRVCDAVSHAHGRLIVHRDLKPSNILVDAAGQPKLLDFGIAKLLDETADATQTIERILTPSYASPEQFRGTHQTTATDIYSLGAVLYKLLTGRSPHQSDSQSAPSIEAIAGARQVAPPTRLNPALPGDLDYILGKALRTEPDERYVSADAFAGDVRALLEWRPVAARSGERWYRTRRFLRRHWAPVTGATVMIAGLALGLLVANRERVIAQRRFMQVRQLANKVLGLDQAISGLPGATQTRHEIVALSKEYLEGLAPEARGDKDLALEIGMAYALLARVQGVPTASNLGQYADAAESLRKADGLLDAVLAASPHDRRALLASADVAQARLILADVNHRRDEVLAYADKAVRRLDVLLSLGKPSQSETELSAVIFSNLALAHKNNHLLDGAVRLARRAMEISRPLTSTRRVFAQAMTMLADSLRLSGDLDGALQTIRASLGVVENAEYASETTRRTSLFNAYWREGVILGEEGSISLGRPDEAILAFQKALDLIEDLAKKDPRDASCRFLLASAGRELGAVLRNREPRRALAVYDQALLRLGEIGNNTKARRGEAEILAGSSYVLRRLHRAGDAKERIDTAYRRLHDTKDYPADRIELGSEADTVLCALGDHLADTGQERRAAEVYQELLDKVAAAKPDPQNDLRHAARLSSIWEALGSLYHRNGEAGRAEALHMLRLELWQQWDRKLPHNGFILRQLEGARVSRAGAARSAPSRPLTASSGVPR